MEFSFINHSILTICTFLRYEAFFLVRIFVKYKDAIWVGFGISNLSTLYKYRTPLFIITSLIIIALTGFITDKLYLQKLYRNLSYRSSSYENLKFKECRLYFKFPWNNGHNRHCPVQPPLRVDQYYTIFVCALDFSEVQDTSSKAPVVQFRRTTLLTYLIKILY